MLIAGICGVLTAISCAFVETDTESRNGKLVRSLASCASAQFAWAGIALQIMRSADSVKEFLANFCCPTAVFEHRILLRRKAQRD